MLTRRHLLATAVVAPAILRFGTGTARAATTLKISHQFPGGTVDKGDFRDRLCRMFAEEIKKRSGGDLNAEVYPNASLIKTNAQFSAMRKGCGCKYQAERESDGRNSERDTGANGHGGSYL